MEIIKKNMVLFVVLGVSVLVSIILIFFVFRVSMTMKDYQAQLVVHRDKIKKLIEDKPAPLKANLDAINLDTNLVQNKVNEIHLIFGKPYRSAIQAFADALGVSETTLYAKWKASYDKEKKLGSVDQIFLKFMSDVVNEGKPQPKADSKAPKVDFKPKADKKVDGEKKAEEDAKKAEEDAKKAEEEAKRAEDDAQKVDNALNAFKAVLEKRTIEDLDQRNLNLLIMEGLGFSRVMSPEVCTAYISSMDAKLNSLVLKADNNMSTLIVPQNTAMFTVLKGMPTADRIPIIIKHYKLLEDIVYRLKETRVKGLNSLAPVSLEGVIRGGFMTLTYKMQIEGSMESTRNFINNLQDAYKENRVYIIRDLSLKQEKDEVKSLGLGTAAAKATGTAPVIPGDRQPRRTGGEDENYGATLIGGSNEIVTELKFDYVIYIADEVKVKKQP
ncbi:MAG: hypothetical protein A2X48_18780 [Lentisphaerae bacterium GWF2_49_21]|nr:MAG: hypothetical protein A2X48_18780 [Lentisphaerae bacterium GWF2_49_21]